MTTNMRTTARTVPFLPGRAGRLFVRPAGTARFQPSRPAAAAMAAVVAVVAASLLLAGCSSAAPPVAGSGSPGQGAGAPSATAAATAAPTNPPTTVPAPAPAYKPATAAGPAQNVPVPVLPAKAKEFSKEGLEAFATYWYSTLGYAFETGDPGPMLAISDPGCKTCQAMEKTVAAGHKEGRWIEGGQMNILSVDSPFALIDDGTYQAITMVRQERVKYYNADRTVRSDLGVTAPIADIVVGIYNNDHWIAITVEHLQGSKK